MQQVLYRWGFRGLLHITVLVGTLLFISPAGAEKARSIALLFDDGPRPDTTPMLLDALRETGMRATFSVIGENVKAHPDLAKRIADEGHEIANRTWSNARLSELSGQAQIDEIAKCTVIVAETTGLQPRLLRVPHGEESDFITELARSQGLTIVRHNFDSGDWRKPPKGIVSRAILDGVTPGSVVLIHESFPAAAAEIPETIRELARRGFVSRTVSELEGLAPRTRLFVGQ